MLSKGQEWDWLGDPFWRVQTLAILFGASLIGLIFWELRSPNPVVNFRPLAERNFAACCIIVFAAYAVLYGASTSLPGLLQSLFGYNALAAGLVMSPAGFFAVLAMPVVSRLLGRQTDARWLIAAGLLLIAASNYWMSQMNLNISPDQVIWASGRLGRGTSDRFCARKCGRLSLHASLVARGGRGPVELAAQRGRQRWNLDGPNPPRTAGAIPYAAAGRVPRSF
jgi:DHA2 family multidrug resistance protein